MSDRKRINLALQGGGSHAAFTWGVLDAPIEDGRLEIEAVSGTSAGAMNAAIFLQGWAKNGPDGARAEFKAFWTDLGAMAITVKGAITGDFGARLKVILIHSINDEASIAPMGSVSKFLIEPAYLEHLFQLGRVAATKWLASTLDEVGVKSSIDIRARFLG